MMNMLDTHLDDLDQRLLDCLQRNARAPVTDLARQLSVSRTTVQLRLRRLEASGVILGYTISKADSLQSAQISALVLISLDSKHSATVVRTLGKFAQVRKLHTISGNYDLCAILAAQNTAMLDQALDEIRAMEGVRDTLSSILLSTKVDR